LLFEKFETHSAKEKSTMIFVLLLVASVAQINAQVIGQHNALMAVYNAAG
jgi:hypothetical protein